MSGGFAGRLLAWYDRHRRPLPWRQRRDPWGTWVSEVMLQQTRVEVVRERWVEFMARYPSPGAWAAADDDEVLGAWRGLGYYRRARLLRDGARAVVTGHAGRIPDDPAELRTLPGVGAYTAGAIASIAFGRAAVAIDGNVERVVARHRGIDAVVKSGAGGRRIRLAVTELLDRARPGDFNQALMDLGATVCTPRGPRCAVCPLAADCAARAAGRQADLPRLPPRRAAVAVETRMAVVRDRGGRFLGQQVAAGRVNAGQLDLPGPGPLVDVAGPDELEQALAAALPVRIDPTPVGQVRHGITHHRIRVLLHAGRLLPPRRVPSGWRFAAADDPAVPWTTIARKAQRAVGDAGGPDIRT